MKTLLFVLSFILILFGVSIWYYRSAPEGGFKWPQFFSSSNKDTSSEGKDKDGNVLSDKTENYKSLEIVEGTSGTLSAGQRRVYFAVAKTESGGSVAVNGSWYLSEDKVGSLESDQGVETTLKTTKEGTTKLFLSYASLKTEKEIKIAGAVLGSKTSPTPTATPKKDSRGSVSPTPTVTPAAEEEEEVTPTSTPAPRVVSINIYDADGRRISIGDSRNFSAKIVFSNGAEKDLEVDWSLSGELGTLSRVHATSTTFKATRVGSGTLTATYQGVSSLLSVQVN